MEDLKVEELEFEQQVEELEELVLKKRDPQLEHVVVVVEEEVIVVVEVQDLNQK